MFILYGWTPKEEICKINTDYTKHTFLKNEWNALEMQHRAHIKYNTKDEFIETSNLIAFLIAPGFAPSLQ